MIQNFSLLLYFLSFAVTSMGLIDSITNLFTILFFIHFLTNFIKCNDKNILTTIFFNGGIVSGILISLKFSNFTLLFDDMIFLSSLYLSIEFLLLN